MSNTSKYILFLVALLISDVWLALSLKATTEELAEAKALNLEAGGKMFECAQVIDDHNALCTEERNLTMSRAIQLFDCAEDVCNASGWEPPYDWKEFERDMALEKVKVKARAEGKAFRGEE